MTKVPRSPSRLFVSALCVQTVICFLCVFPLSPVSPQPDDDDEEDLSPEERRVLERKMKKILKKEERKRLKVEGRTEAVVAAAPSASQQALDYLSWYDTKHHRCERMVDVVDP